MDLRKPDGVTIIGVVILLALVGFIVKDFVLSPEGPSSFNSPSNGLGAGTGGEGSPQVEELNEVAVPQAASPQQVQVQPPADGTGLLSAYPVEKREVPGGVRVSETVGDYN